MPDYTIGVYDFDPFFTFSRTVNGEIVYGGPANSETTAVITDNGSGVAGEGITDSDETATGTITINGNTSTGVDISAEESWTLLNVDTGETFQIITFEIESGPAAGYYTISEQPLVPGATYRTITFDTDPSGSDATFSYADYVTDIPDGTVDGTDGDDVIDGSYEGDPQGEEVDNLDSPTVTPVSLDLNWDAEGADETDLFGGVSQDTGGIQVDVSFTDDGAGTEWSVESTQTQYVGPGESFDANSALLLFGNGPTGDTSTMQVDFSSVSGSGYSDEVTDVQFRINDIDSATGAFRDVVTVRAFDADGNEVEVQFTIGGDETLSGNTITGGDNANSESDLDGSVLITIPGPVAYFIIDYDQGGTGTQAVYITDIEFNAMPLGANDDVIDAGDGDDSIDSGEATDTVFGGTGDDTINASEDDDTLFGGDDADTFQMGDGLGDDSIVGGEGGTDNETIDASALTSGVTVTFTGGEEGTVDGVDTDATFSEIETLILTDQDDVVNGSASSESMTIVAGDGDDNITGGSGADSIDGGDGDDTINLNDGFGADTIDGGSGGETEGDTLDASDLSSGTTVTMDGDGSGTLTDGTDTATFDDIEIIETGSNDDTIDGAADTTGMTLIGGGGDDSIEGGSGDDVIYGDGGDPSEPGVWLFEYYDLDPTGDPRTLEQAGFTLNGGRDHEGTPTDTGYSDSIDPTDYDTADDYALSFTSQISITTGGDYTFETTSDDGSQLFINGQLVVDNDGHHGMVSQNGTITLPPGDYIIEIIYYENDGGNGLTASVSGPDTGDVATTLTGYPGLSPVPESGSDTLNGGAGDDTIFAGADDDTIILEDGFGNDTIEGGEGGIDSDTIDASAVTEGVTLTFTDGEEGTLTTATDTATFSEVERFVLTDQDDTVDGSLSDDEMTIFAGAGDDTIIGGTGADIIFAGADDDTLTGGDGNDTLFGGDGDDTITAGEGDTATGGDGDDTFIIDQTDTGTGGITIVGGEGDETAGDTLDFNGLLDLGSLVITDDDDANGGLTGFAFLLDGTRVDFSEIENIICFARGTNILTHSGEVLIEDLAEGDQIVTLDHGLQQIRWIGSRSVPATGDFAPITISKGTLGNHSDLTVSPQHRMLVSGPMAELLFCEPEVLIPAKHLLSWDGVYRAQMDTVEYFHILFNSHQVIHANGAPSESFHPGEQAMDAVSQEARAEILALFPELADQPAAYGPAARASLKGYEAEVLGRGMA